MKPMENVNEIVARLNQGESLENIATELTAVLNEAKKVYDTEQREKEAQAKARHMAEVKRAELSAILDQCVAWIKEFYPDFYADLAKELTEADSIALYDVILDSVIKAMDKTASETRNLFNMDPMTMMLMSQMMNQPVKATPRSKSEDDILNDFINKICQ
jgi:hypothetical protein